MFRMAVLLMSLFATFAMGQVWSGQALKLPTGISITVDGNLSEAVWSNSTKYSLDPTNNLLLGTIDNSQDCSLQFMPLWDSQALYIGYWFQDDIHNAPHSQYLDDANNGYNDDCIETWLDASYDDAANYTAGNMGLNGWHLINGMGNLDPTQQYRGWWKDDYGAGKGYASASVSVTDQQTLGSTALETQTC